MLVPIRVLLGLPAVVAMAVPVISGMDLSQLSVSDASLHFLAVSQRGTALTLVSLTCGLNYCFYSVNPEL